MNIIYYGLTPKKKLFQMGNKFIQQSIKSAKLSSVMRMIFLKKFKKLQSEELSK